MRITITGGAGFIGWHLAKRLSEDGHRVTTVDKLPLPVPIPGVQHIPSRLDGENGAWAVFEDKPEVIYHLAAEAGVHTSPLDAILQNTVVVTDMLDRMNPSTKFVFASSGAVYSLPRDRWNDVKPDRAPYRSAYGISKMASEELIRLAAQKQGINYTITRFGNIFGFQWKPKAVVGLFLKAALERTRPVIHGDGTQKRDFTYVGDVVEALASAAWNGYQATVDIATGVSLPVVELWATIAEVVSGFGFEVNAPVFDLDSSGGTKESRLEPDKAAVIKWEPQTNLRDGLERIVTEILHHQEVRTEIDAVWLGNYPGTDPIRIQGSVK